MVAWWACAWNRVSRWARIGVAGAGILASAISAHAIGWSVGRPLNPAPVVNNRIDYPAAPAATDGAGRWIAAWGWSDYTVNPARERVYVTSSDDDAASWNAPVCVTDAVNGATGRAPAIATDRHGRWVCAWTGERKVGGQVLSRGDIFVSRSIDGGATWTHETVIRSTGTTSTANTYAMPRLATDGNGTWICTWGESEPATSATAARNYVLFSRSTDSAATWSAPVPVNPDQAADEYPEMRPCVATDGQGHWVLNWWRGNAFDSTVANFQSARSADNGATWSAPATVNPFPVNTQSLLNAGGEIAFDTTGTCVAAWHHRPGPSATTARLYTSASSDFGATWGTPVLARSAGDVEALAYSIAPDNRGLWLVGWTETNTTTHLVRACVAASTDGAQTWSQPDELPEDSDYLTQGEVFGPYLAAGSSGAWVALTANNYSPPNSNLAFHVIATRGVLNPPPYLEGTQASQLLNRNGNGDTGNDVLPDVAGDGYGTWVCVWGSDDTLSGTIGADNDILFARRDSVTAPWSAPLPLNTGAATDAASDIRPRIATDGHGVWMTVWASKDTSASALGADFDILMARSLDNGHTWTPPVPLNAGAAGDTTDEASACIASDGNGCWVVGWSEAPSSTDPATSGIRCIRSLDNGANWSLPVLLPSGGYAYSYPPEIATNGTGGWVITWVAGSVLLNNSSKVVYFSTDHAATWARSPIDFSPCSSTAVAWNPAAREWMLLAQETRMCYRSFCWGAYDVKGCRSTDGGSSWTELASLTGVPLDPGFEGSPQAAADPFGNMVVSWSSIGFGQVFGDDTDIFVCVSRDAAATWLTRVLEPRALADPAGASDDNARVATDSRGHWTIVWSGRESGGADADIRYATLTTPVPTAAADWALYE